MCFREAPHEDPPEAEDAGGREAPGAAGLAAVERLQRAAQQEDPRASQGQPSPPKKPYRAPSVPSLCALATRATVHLMTGKRPFRTLTYKTHLFARTFYPLSASMAHLIYSLLQLPACSTAAVWHASPRS